MPIPSRMHDQARRVTGFLRGAQGLAAVAEHERQQEERRNRPFAPSRFWLPCGGERTIIFLDDWFTAETDAEAPKSGIIVTEHTHTDPATGKMTDHRLCPASMGYDCEDCRAGVKATVRFICTVYEVGEWTDKKGKLHKGSRRLLAVPANAKEQWLGLQRVARNNGHTMRGMWINLKRGTEPTAISSGVMQPQDDGRLFAMVSEKTMRKHYWNGEIRSERDRNLIVHAEGEDLQPVRYEDIFTLDVQESRPAAGRSTLPPLPGSASSNRGVLDDDDDELPGLPNQNRQTTSGRASTSPGGPPDADEDDDVPPQDRRPAARSTPPQDTADDSDTRNAQQQQQAARPRSRNTPAPQQQQEPASTGVRRRGKPAF